MHILISVVIAILTLSCAVESSEQRSSLSKSNNNSSDSTASFQFTEAEKQQQDEIMAVLDSEDMCQLSIALSSGSKEAYQCVLDSCPEDVHAYCYSGCGDLIANDEEKLPEHCVEIKAYIDSCEAGCKAKYPSNPPIIFRRPDSYDDSKTHGGRYKDGESQESGNVQ